MEKKRKKGVALCVLLAPVMEYEHREKKTQSRKKKTCGTQNIGIKRL